MCATRAGEHQNGLSRHSLCHLRDSCHCAITVGFPTDTQHQPCSPRMLSWQTRTNSERF